MPAAKLLSRLAGVRVTGRTRWMARCPAHEDADPSLSVRELDDGMVLVHCFAGCSVEDVLAAVGLEFSDLFADGVVPDRVPGMRRPLAAADVLQAMAREALVVAQAASRVGQGEVLSEEERALLLSASERLQRAVEMAG